MEKIFFRANLLSISCDHVETVLKILRKKNANGPKTFCWKSETDKVNCVFEKTFTLPQESFGKVGCSPDSPARIASLKVRFFFLEVRKLLKIGFFWNLFILQNVPLLPRNQFWQPCWYFATKTPNCFAESPKLTKSVSVSSKNTLFPPNISFDQVEFRFGRFSKKFQPEVN